MAFPKQATKRPRKPEDGEMIWKLSTGQLATTQLVLDETASVEGAIVILRTGTLIDPKTGKSTGDVLPASRHTIYHAALAEGGEKVLAELLAFLHDQAAEQWENQTAVVKLLATLPRTSNAVLPPPAVRDGVPITACDAATFPSLRHPLP